MNVQCSGSLKFCKGNESLEDEERGGQQSEGDNDHLRASSNLILLQLHERLPTNSTRLLCGHLACEANWKGEKAQ